MSEKSEVAERAPSVGETGTGAVGATGMWIAMGGMLMFFSALASAFIERRGLAPAGVEPALQLPNRLLALNTAVLLGGSAALELSSRGLRKRGRAAFLSWWGVACVLGALFLAGQLFAWREM